MIDVDAAALAKHVEVVEGTALLRQDDTVREFKITELPSKFIRWQLDYKASIYDAIEKGSPMRIKLALPRLSWRCKLEGMSSYWRSPLPT